MKEPLSHQSPSRAVASEPETYMTKTQQDVTEGPGRLGSRSWGKDLSKVITVPIVIIVKTIIIIVLLQLLWPY